MITIDGIAYNIPVKGMPREASILIKDGAKRTQDGVLHAEAIGTFYNCSLSMGCSQNNVNEYASLWLKVTEPSVDHTITVPDESGELTFNCYFANIRDECIRVNVDGVAYFRNLSFDVIGTSPARTP